jgi:hypothetical protein
VSAAKPHSDHSRAPATSKRVVPILRLADVGPDDVVSITFGEPFSEPFRTVAEMRAARQEAAELHRAEQATIIALAQQKPFGGVQLRDAVQALAHRRGMWEHRQRGRVEKFTGIGLPTFMWCLTVLAGSRVTYYKNFTLQDGRGHGHPGTYLAALANVSDETMRRVVVQMIKYGILQESPFVRRTFHHEARDGRPARLLRWNVELLRGLI